MSFGTTNSGADPFDISLAVSNFGGILPAQPINNDSGAGIQLTSGGGDLILGTIPGTTVTGSTYGVDVETTGAGTVTMTIGDNVSGASNDGVYASTDAGNISITTDAGTDVSTGTPASAYGIRADSNTGNIGITTNGTVSDGGIGAVTGGSGTITVTTNDDVTTTGGDAIYVSGVDGLISVTANAGVTGAVDGIDANSSGTGNVDVTAAADTVISGTNGAGISATGAGGTVTVTANGTSITGLTDGIYAANTTGNVVVDLNSGTVTGTGNSGEGIYATTGGAGTITITQDAGTTVNSRIDDGIEAVSTGTGLIHITSNGNITAGNNGGDDGITAIGLAGGAPITIDFGTGNVDASITAAGNGIEAQTSGTGKITINADGTISNAAGDLGANGGTLQNNESGIWTKQTGTGDIEINTGTKSISAGNNLYDYGIYAQVAGGAIDITTGTGTVTGGDDAIHAEVLGGDGNIDITTGGEVTSLTDVGIYALNSGGGTGDITVTNNGTVGNSTTATAGSGIVATNTNNASTGNVTVNVNNSIYADGVYGAAASTDGSGDAKVIVADDVTIDPTGYGAYAYSAGGNASVTTNDGDTVTVAGAGAVGLYAQSDKASGTDTAVVTTGDNGLVTVTGANAVGIEATNQGGGTGSVKVDTATNGGTNGTALVVSGDQAIGILAATADPTLGVFNGSGDVTVTTGAGNITVTGGATTSVPTVGIAALTDGGNISITTGTGAIDVSSTGNNTVGIYANAGRQGWGTPAGQVDIATYGAITTSNGNGIEAYSHDGNLNIDTYAAIDATGDRGIYADADGTGDVTIVTHAGGTISGNANDGIKAESDLSGTGNVSVTINDAIGTSGNYVGNNGIEANVLNSGSAGTVKVQANASIYAGNNGILASNAGSGTVDVTAGTDTVIDATNGAGISATGAGGTVTVTADGTSITGSTDGIYAENTTGNIVVDLNSGTVTGTGSGGEGIYATTGNTGTITITQDAGTTVDSTSDDGIEAVSTGTGLIHITSNGTITAGNNGGDDGITAIGLSGGAPITIDFGTGNTNASITAAGNGIEAQTSGAGKVTVNAYGAINNTTGDLGANAGTLQNNESGIWTKQTGTGDIEVNTGTKAITAGTGTYDYGIYAQAADGNIDITTGTGTVTGGDDGIHAEVLAGSGHVNVTANGDVTSTVGSAIDVASNTGNIDITNYGAATSSADPVVNATTNGGSVTINNEVGSSIQATGLSPSWSALAIQTSTGTGAVLVQNDGDITGRVDFDLTSTGGATFNNTANTWYTSGDNNFTAGDDTLTNTSTGDIHTGDTTTFAFGAGNDTVANAGHFFVTGDTSFTGLENFNNSGTLDLSADNTDTTDTVTISGAFNGTGSSKLVLDSYLDASASADYLTVLGGTTGSTAIRVNNVATGYGAWLGSNFSDGILLVNGSSSASNFSLDTTQALYNSSIDALDAGLFNYKLVFNGGEERLISLPGNEASELPTFLTAAQSIWYETSPWLDRQADLRDQLKGGEGTVTPGVWGKALGRWTSRDLSQTVSAGGTSITNKADYDQDTYGFVAGVDTGSSNVLGQGDTLLGGVSAGYVTSDQNFKASPTTAEYKGAVLGIYGTYLKGGFFIDAMAKANLLTMDYKAPSLGGATASPDVKSYGVEVDAGQRFPISDSAFFEPLASLTYAKTQIDTFSVANSQFDFQDATSFRGSLGLRGGATAYKSSETKVDLSLTGRLWNEFEGDNKMVIRSGGPDLTMTDKFDGTFGEVVGSVNVFGLGDGLSGFVNGGAKFKSNYTSGELTAGLRYEW
ncbi:MAG: hypothetical protein WAW54_08020 [Parvibaculum sedimenti]|uniref:hypothetical protein n=1 Tax=Parvibaculum sedimenti TaxID=2608632 RepID=UPI003BB4F233